MKHEIKVIVEEMPVLTTEEKLCLLLNVPPDRIGFEILKRIDRMNSEENEGAA